MTMTQLITVQERTETWNSDKGNGITMKQLNGTERMGQKEETVPKTATEEKKRNQEQDTGHAIKQHKMTKINEDTKKIKHTNSTNDCPRGKRSAGTMAQTSSAKRKAAEPIDRTEGEDMDTHLDVEEVEKRMMEGTMVDSDLTT